MGCDIHVYTEFKLWYGKNEGKWFSADHYKLNPSYGEDDSEKKMEVVPIYDSRNYSLFSILAGVRNYGGNEQISELHGLPDDCCPEIKEESDSWGEDGHSHSFFTLKELLDFQKIQSPVKYQGFVSKKSSENLDRGILPEEYWQGGNIPGQVWRKWEKTDESLKPFVKALVEREKEIFWIFSDKSKDIQKHAEEIRVVFWFDN